MNINDRDRRALILLAAGLAVAGILYVFFPANTASTPVAAPTASNDNVAFLQQRLVRLRQIAATLPAREATLKQVNLDLSDREHGIIQADTAAQAQAAVLEAARRIGKNSEIDVRGGDFGAPKPLGEYGLVYVTITFSCHVEQLVNFIADLSKEPQTIVPSEERMSSADPKEKTMSVRMVLAGLVAKKLVPEKKGLAAF